jgi:predicted DNA-binding transcriptional regulator YafY
MKDSKRADIASMDHAEALTLSLAKTYLSDVLPINHSVRMGALFKRAENFLDQMQGSDLIKWKDKVRVIPVTHGYVAPKIKDEVQGTIYESLLREKQFAGKYLSREATKSKKAIFNPLAIVSHGVVTRVICTREIGGQTDNIIRYLPIHRFKSVRSLEDKINIPDGFKLDDYLSSGQIEYLYDQNIKLHLKFTHSAGLHLTETPFSKDQEIKIVKGKSITLKANTPFTETLKRWILGFGDQVKVMGPAKLKKEIQEIHKRSLT